MRLDDWCCLGRTVPEESKKYGRKVCAAGFSRELGEFVRVYPLPVVTPIRQRSVCVLELGRNPQDSRRESWRLAREQAGAGIASVGPQLPKADVLAWLAPRRADSIRELNERRASVGVLRVAAADLQGVFADRETRRPEDPTQALLFADLDEQFGAGVIRLAPYVRFRDGAGEHRLQIREWGGYEWLRKGGPCCQLWENYGFNDEDAFVWLVVGNMSNQRTAWLVISAYVEHPEPTLFPTGPEGVGEASA